MLEMKPDFAGGSEVGVESRGTREGGVDAQAPSFQPSPHHSRCFVLVLTLASRASVGWSVAFFHLTSLVL